jgi:hypothetical protein
LSQVHLGILKRFSPVFSEICGIPPTTGTNIEGAEVYPIFPQDVTTEEFSNLLFWIYRT